MLGQVRELAGPPLTTCPCGEGSSMRLVREAISTSGLHRLAPTPQGRTDCWALPQGQPTKYHQDKLGVVLSLYVLAVSCIAVGGQSSW